ncbi:MAG TPA: sialidase family protein, partial [Acidimicrobiales bacterium]
MDATGQHVVIGYNDFRGFARSPVSVSGYMYSSDGGQTFTDGGQLPVSAPANGIYGDPEIKFLGGCTFIYSSIYLTPAPATQSMAVHRSTDCGQTWSGPYEVAAATIPGAAADKEFMDVDPDTGRVMMTWTSFGATVQILSAVSDDGGLTWPASGRRLVSGDPADGQASIPRFAGLGSPNAYVAWRRFPFPGTLFGYGNTTAFARSTDNGLTWGTPIELSPEFLTADYILGNDRSNTSPSLAVDNSTGPYQGSVYVVYANNDSQDGSDIVFQKSTNEGVSFSSPLLLNSRPGGDRAQWFPWVTVDAATGRVYVFYYDQGSADSGDLSQVAYTYSDDGGASWKQPLPLTDRPFHAGWSNDTGQPNLGDYNQAVAQGAELFAAFAVAGRPPLGFVDGQPDTSLTSVDTAFRRIPEARHKFKATTLDLVGVRVADSGRNGYVDPDETITLTATLRNYVTNPLNADKVRGATATLTTTTPGVTVVRGFSPLPNLGPGQTGANRTPFVLRTAASFVAGASIELALHIRSAEHGEMVL